MEALAILISSNFRFSLKRSVVTIFGVLSGESFFKKGYAVIVLAVAM